MNPIKYLTKKLMKNITKLAAKENPEKVKAFLTDMAVEPSFPQEVRKACQGLLDAMNDGKPLDVAMQESTTKSIEKLEKDLIGKPKEQENQ